LRMLSSRPLCQVLLLRIKRINPRRKRRQLLETAMRRIRKRRKKPRQRKRLKRRPKRRLQLKKLLPLNCPLRKRKLLSRLPWRREEPLLLRRVKMIQLQNRSRLRRTREMEARRLSTTEMRTCSCEALKVTLLYEYL